MPRSGEPGGAFRVQRWLRSLRAAAAAAISRKRDARQAAKQALWNRVPLTEGMAMKQLVESFRVHRHVVLLLALIFLALMQPLVHGIVGGTLLFDGVFSLVLLGIVAAIFNTRRTRIVAFWLAVPTLAARWAAAGLSGEQRLLADVVHHGATVVFLGYAMVTILRGIFEEEVIRIDHFVGTICGYVLAGVAWGNCYTIADLLTSQAFRVAPEIASQLQDAHTRSFYFNYYSLSVITGAGFGDITPLGPLVTTLSWLEAGFGQFYIAAVVAQLVSLKFTRMRGSDGRD
jgi:hypothetical protein